MLKRLVLVVVLVLLALLGLVWGGRAQNVGPLLVIHGLPDSTTSPPQVRTYASVIDRSTAQTVENLTADNFSLKEAGQPVESLTVSYEPVGLAIVVVVDRGGISWAGDPRLEQATDLIRDLIDQLGVTGESSDDVLAIVGVAEEGVLDPEENFSYNPVDNNRILNALMDMEDQTLQGSTPLYEGVEEALRLLTQNSETAIRQALSRRRKLILVFSDGIDQRYSDEVREGDIVRRAEEADVSIYTIGMARSEQTLDSDAERNLKRLANQTNGFYQLHNNDETHRQVLDLFDRLLTQRYQYLLSYPTHQPLGNYSLRVIVDTNIGSAERQTAFDSILELPQLALTSPGDGLKLTVPYSESVGRFISTTLTLSVSVNPVDGVPRNPAQVHYFANGALVGTGETPPDFAFDWAVSTIVSPTEENQLKDFTLTAQAVDAYLNAKMATDKPVTIRLTWEAMPSPTPPGLLERLQENWWLLLIAAGLVLGLAVLVVLFKRPQSQTPPDLDRQPKATQRLLPTTNQALAKLVVTRGTRPGKEYPVTDSLVQVGRNAQICDIVLDDEFVSNLHFSIHLDQAQFYIQDEGSSNGTKVNGTPLRPHRRELLPADALIEVAYTELQFKRTRRVGHGGQSKRAS